MPGLEAKGKQRAIPVIPPPWGSSGALPRRHAQIRWDVEGSGGQEGIVLPLQYMEDGPMNVAYTIPVLIGSDDERLQNLSLQVDTGSSDLWVASTACGTDSCSSTPRYDPSITGIQAPAAFNIEYLIGAVSGPVYWDTVTIGGYSVANQALAAADAVESEPLTSQFSGILGLALPSNSVIGSEIEPKLDDTPDGAIWASNLFSITPNTSAPAAPFLSVALERPGSSKVPSVLGIGRHPAALVPDPSRIDYEMLYAPSPDGPLFWKAAVHGITVYTESSRMEIPLGRGASGTAYPSAVLDTGMPVILTTAVLANAIYGAIGVQPASDNMYYLPCKTPLNITFTLDSRPEIPLHPLDLSAMPAKNADQSQCLGLIQTSADERLSHPSNIGDMVLGVPFLRNVYSVLAFDIPVENGTFPLSTLSNSSKPIRPRLGLMGLTNATVAMDEFYRVRVMNQPLSDDGGSGAAASAGGGKKGIKSVGVEVLIGLASFAGLCALVFTIRWILVRRHMRRNGGNGDGFVADGDDYAGARRTSGTYRDVDGIPLPTRRRGAGPDAYMHSMHTVSTDRTHYADERELEKEKEPDVLQALAAAAHEREREREPAVPITPLPVSPTDSAPLLPPRDQSVEREYEDRERQMRPNASVSRERPPSMAGIGSARHRESFVRGRTLSGLTPTEERGREALRFSSASASSSRSPAPGEAL
ncbi:Peptidase A1 domain-containing protein [Mycena kentingensis (nom. inval.)]|nr:Peptidase A1 domain-containing protein [Mycena kentingensis (nom. inval.)]